MLSKFSIMILIIESNYFQSQNEVFGQFSIKKWGIRTIFDQKLPSLSIIDRKLSIIDRKFSIMIENYRIFRPLSIFSIIIKNFDSIMRLRSLSNRTKNIYYRNCLMSMWWYVAMPEHCPSFFFNFTYTPLINFISKHQIA